MQPVKYDGAVADIVAAYNSIPADQKVAAYWSTDAAGPVRKAIKDHYIEEQHQRCCYCGHHIATNNNAVWDGEHVISRETKPAFMFEPRNLAVSCKDCNIAKSVKGVLKNKDRKTFPSKSTDYIIVHPHFDEYDDHIHWIGPVVYAAPSDSRKGSITIEMCDLTRYARQSAALKGSVYDRRFRDRMGELMITRTQEDAADVLAELELQIKKLPKKV
ncbi:hypothetical protein HZY97_08380 [Sphingomonas sp. R-74633]|uniref:HNH endonuclease n=1 Tax=Sphingomonas sp. R-74633 TaxID=2751188 RepID=UPI0015D1CE58|nr:hypothetical protein [Sphingomonas sp. R-74633]NYT40770.1 hypothetical protein [Sphingomonas sp. R-74633]